MTVMPNFDIANDLKVEMLLPQDVNNVFVLGLSLLGGTDVLGDDAAGYLAWQDLACEVNRVQTSIGGSIASNVYFQADAGKATIQLQSWEFDPNNYTFIRPGTEVRIRTIRDGVAFILWQGTVDNIDVSYAPDQPNQITIDATDYWALVVNRRLDYNPVLWGGIDTIYPSEAINCAMQTLATTGFSLPYDPVVSIFLEWNMTQTAETNTTFGSVVANALNSGLGFAWINPDTGYLVYRPRSTGGVAIYTIGNNHGEENHLCMADLSVTTQSDDIFTNVLVTQKYEYLGNPVFTQLYADQDLTDLYGERSSDFTVDLASTTDADSWANAVFAPKPVTHVQNVVTPTVDRNGNLTEASQFMPGDVVGVKYQTANINIDTDYTITRVRHSIDVNNWFTTLELWKEF